MTDGAGIWSDVRRKMCLFLIKISSPVDEPLRLAKLPTKFISSGPVWRGRSCDNEGFLFQLEFMALQPPVKDLCPGI